MMIRNDYLMNECKIGPPLNVFWNENKAHSKKVQVKIKVYYLHPEGCKRNQYTLAS
jgi:hypothetical protein